MRLKKCMVVWQQKGSVLAAGLSKCFVPEITERGQGSELSESAKLHILLGGVYPS
jgi:hypothetical protein